MENNESMGKGRGVSSFNPREGGSVSLLINFEVTSTQAESLKEVDLTTQKSIGTAYLEYCGPNTLKKPLADLVKEINKNPKIFKVNRKKRIRQEETLSLLVEQFIDQGHDEDSSHVLAKELLDGISNAPVAVDDDDFPDSDVVK